MPSKKTQKRHSHVFVRFTHDGIPGYGVISHPRPVASFNDIKNLSNLIAGVDPSYQEEKISIVSWQRMEQ